LGGRSACTQADPTVGRGIVSWIDIRETYGRLTRQLAELVGCGKCVISLYESETREFVCQWPGHNVADELLKKVRYPADALRPAWNFRLLGEMAAHPAALDAGQARARYVEALTLATELGMCPLVAHCHLGLGKLYRRTSDHAKTEEHLRTATAMYREMDMGFWLEKTETELCGGER